MGTLINSNQIRAVGNTSKQTLINPNQVRAEGDTSTETLINSNQVASVIPAQYTIVDYIQSAGGPYINTGIKPDDTTIIQAKFVMTNFDGGTFIGYSGSENNCFRFFRSVSETYLDYGSGSGKNRIGGSFITSQTKIYEVEFGNRYVKDLSTDKIKFSSTTVSFNEKTYTIRMFDETNYGKMYYFKIKKQGVWVADYVPVYDTETSKYGMYDIIAKTFKGRSGSGNFTGGNDD